MPTRGVRSPLDGLGRPGAAYGTDTARRLMACQAPVWRGPSRCWVQCACGPRHFGAEVPLDLVVCFANALSSTAPVRTGPRRTLPGSTRRRLMRASADQGRPVGRRGACCRPCRCPAARSCPRGWRAALGRLRQSLAPVPDMPRAHPGCREVGRQARSSRQTRCRKVSRNLLASARRALQGACTGPDRSQPGVSSSRWTSSPWTCSPQVSQTVWVTSSWSR